MRLSIGSLCWIVIQSRRYICWRTGLVSWHLLASSNNMISESPHLIYLFHNKLVILKGYASYLGHIPGVYLMIDFPAPSGPTQSLLPDD
jgi:hypothetical protein